MSAFELILLGAFLAASAAAIVQTLRFRAMREDVDLAFKRADELREQNRLQTLREDQLRQVIDGARCILWDATVTDSGDPNEALQWNIRILSPETSRVAMGLAAVPEPDDSQVWRKRMPEHDMERLNATSTQAIRSGAPGYHQEFELGTPDGGIRFMREEVRIRPSGEGRWNLVGVQVDVTELKRVQDELARERDLLHSLLDNIPDQIYFKDTQSRFLRINRAVAETIDAVSPESALGRTDHDYFSKNEADAFRADDELVMETRQVLRDRIEHAVAHGREMWMSTTKAPLFDKNGEVAGLVGISRDITDRMMVEKALEHERDLLQALMDNIPDPIYFKDLNSSYLRINKADVEFVGAQSAEGAVGKSDIDYFTAEEAKAFKFDDQMVMRTGKALRDRVEQAVRNGKLTWLSTTKAPITGKDGKVIGMVGVTRDITDRVLAEQNLNDVVTRAQCILWRAEVTLGEDTEHYIWKLNIFSSQQIRDWLGLGPDHGGDDSYNWSRCFDPEDMIEMEKRFPQAVRESLPGYQQEFRIRGKDSRVRWVSESVQISPVGDGRWNLVGVVTDITDRKLAEQRIRENEARLRLLVEQMPAILWTCDRNLRFTYSVGSGLETLGLSPNQLIGTSLYEYFETQDDNFVAIAAHREALNGGKRLFQSEWQNRVFQTYVEPLYNGDGGIDGVIGLAFDVTEQKQAQEALRDRELLLRRVLDTNPNIIMVKDRRGTILLANAALAEFYHAPMDQMTGRTHREVHLTFGGTPADIDRWLESDREVVATGQPRFSTEYITQAGGRLRWHRTKKLPITLANGTQAVLTVMEDVTDLKQAEKMLEKERDLLEALMDNIPDNIYYKDIHSRFIRINRQQSGYLGLQGPADAIGKTDYDFFSREHADEFYNDEREVMSGKRIISKFERIVLRGAERWWLVSKVPFFDRDGRVLGLVGVSKDVTELKKMERQLADANEQLNKLAREDALTGLLNRRMILELVSNEWARWQRYGKRYSILILDADNFKRVNDEYGHLAGDQALKFIAARISEAIRAVDIVGRYGGEEFIVILPETNQEGAMSAAEKILHNIRKSPLSHDGGMLNLSVSIGSATVRSEDRNEDILLNRADQALLEAKRAGKNRVIAAPL
jgi:diguanylate cyclase (GGDEF)-like protein/PAS domain S-box-containing protein